MRILNTLADPSESVLRRFSAATGESSYPPTTRLTSLSSRTDAAVFLGVRPKRTIEVKMSREVTMSLEGEVERQFEYLVENAVVEGEEGEEGELNPDELAEYLLADAILQRYIQSVRGGA